MLLIELYSTETTICRLLEVAERKRKTKLPFVYMYRVYVNYDNNWRLGGRRGRDRMLIGFIQLPMQYVPITNNVVSSNLDHG
jgi:hypothetical protein